MSDAYVAIRSTTEKLYGIYINLRILHNMQSSFHYFCHNFYGESCYLTFFYLVVRNGHVETDYILDSFTINCIDNFSDTWECRFPNSNSSLVV